jgi:hypothetical protein
MQNLFQGCVVVMSIRYAQHNVLYPVKTSIQALNDYYTELESGARDDTNYSDKWVLEDD